MIVTGIEILAPESRPVTTNVVYKAELAPNSVLTVVAIAFIITVGLWVEGIDYMNTHHPDYKGEDFLNEEEEVYPIYKFNNGRGAMLCNKCRTILSTGPKTEELYCEKCKTK